MLRSEMNLRSPAMMMMTGEVYLAWIFLTGEIVMHPGTRHASPAKKPTSPVNETPRPKMTPRP